MPTATRRSSRCCASRSASAAARLDALALPPVDAGGRFTRSHLAVAADEEALEAAFAEARGRRNEGLMVKDPTSIYSPGRRGLGWLKMKKALATIDCVVVGVEVGHGKRHGVLSDYTFAVRDDETGKLVNIGKAYSGLTDAEIAEMTAWFEAHTIARFGRYRQVEPTVVVEIAFDVIVRSKRHGSGFSLRFPRIHALRPDKSVDDIDTVETVTALYEGLQHGVGIAGDGRRQDGAARARLTTTVPSDRPRILRPCSMAGRRAAARGLTLYTDAFVIRGPLATRQRRVTDMLNLADDAVPRPVRRAVRRIRHPRRDDPGRVRPGQPRSRCSSRWPTTPVDPAPGAADPQGAPSRR